MVGSRLPVNNDGRVHSRVFPVERMGGRGRPPPAAPAEVLRRLGDSWIHIIYSKNYFIFDHQLGTRTQRKI
jgi:hypothetical protein